MPADETPPALTALSVVVFSGSYDRVHYALAMAAAALSNNQQATLFFTMGATRGLLAGDASGPGWHRLHGTEDGRRPQDADQAATQRGLGGFEELLAACVALGGRVMVCEMGLRALGLDLADLRGDVPVVPGGLVTFLSEAPRHGATMFV